MRRFIYRSVIFLLLQFGEGFPADMSESSNLSLGGFTSDLVIKFDSSHPINVPNPLTYVYLNLPLLALTLTLNLWAVVVISGKEKTGINFLLIINCFASIFFMALGTLRQSPWFSFESSTLCMVFVFFYIFLNIFNRLVPVAIAIILYIMICHPTFSINQGGEKRISAIVRNIIFLLSLTSSLLTTLKRQDVRTYLVCMGREEMFR